MSGENGYSPHKNAVNLSQGEIGEAKNSLAPQSQRSMIPAQETLVVGKCYPLRSCFNFLTLALLHRLTSGVTFEFKLL